MTNNRIEMTPNICPARENAFLRVVKFCPDSQEKAIAMIASMILQPQKKDASPNMNPTTEAALWRGLSAAPYFSKTSSVFSAYSRRKFFANALSYPADGTHIAVLFQFRDAMLALKHIYIPLFSFLLKPRSFRAGLSVRYFLRFTYLVWSISWALWEPGAPKNSL